MEVYQSEQEQVEALKRWWKENGRTALLGLGLGLGGVFGWVSWQSYTQDQAEQASALYDGLVGAVTTENQSVVSERINTLIQDHPDSGYAALGALVAAGESAKRNEIDTAKGHLQWVLEHAAPELQGVARLRLARLHLGEENADGAIALLDQGAPESLMSGYEELRGDALLSKQVTEDARAAYERALAALPESSSARRRLQMKLDDLGRLSFSDDSLKGATTQ